MRIVIDSNRVMAGLIRDSVSRIIILNEDFDFVAPDFLEVELGKHHDYLVKKSRMTEREFDLVLVTLLERLELIPEEDFIGSMELAEEMMKDVDIKDAPFLAVGMACKVKGIWSEDKDFDKQNLLVRYSTGDLIDLLSENR
jgi:predicted nucleic acid-binding protein